LFGYLCYLWLGPLFRWRFAATTATAAAAAAAAEKFATANNPLATFVVTLDKHAMFRTR
jgi:hypothetical protein